MKTLKEFLNEASWSRDVEQMGIKSAYDDEDNSQRTRDEIANAGPKRPMIKGPVERYLKKGREKFPEGKSGVGIRPKRRKKK